MAICYVIHNKHRLSWGLYCDGCDQFGYRIWASETAAIASADRHLASCGGYKSRRLVHGDS